MYNKRERFLWNKHLKLYTTVLSSCNDKDDLEVKVAAHRCGAFWTEIFVSATSLRLARLVQFIPDNRLRIIKTMMTDLFQKEKEIWIT